MSKVGIIEFDKLEIGDILMRNNTYLREWRCPLPSLTSGSNMFSSCYNLTAFSSNLSSLTDGSGMFHWCKALTSFSSDLPSLTQGRSMFNYCTNLKSFTSNSSGSPVNLSSLTGGFEMFQDCYQLTSFNSELPSLTNGEMMFYNCYNLRSFTSDLSSLKIGEYMFYNCKSLDTVTIKLKDISTAKMMFAMCGKLKNLNLEYYANGSSGGIDCRGMFGGCDFRDSNLQVSLTNKNASSKQFLVADGRRMFGYPEEKDSNDNLTSNYVLNGTQWGKLTSGGWWLRGADNPRGAIFEATVDSNIMVTQSDGSQWCSATNLFSLGFRYFRIKYKDSNNKPVVVYGDKNMSPEYTFEKPDTAFWNNQIDDLSVAWVG